MYLKFAMPHPPLDIGRVCASNRSMMIAILMTAMICFPVGIILFVLFFMMRKKSKAAFLFLIFAILALLPAVFWGYLLLSFRLTDL